jgi:DNA-binding CsgD family transcriptional regulator
MVDLVLGDADQRTLRSLLQVEPARGVPVPTTAVLESVLTLVDADAIGVSMLDRCGRVVDETGLPAPGAGRPDEARVLDSLELGWSVGRGYAARLHVDRTRRRFTERDVAMFRLLTPVLARLLRGASGSSLPASLTVQERRVLGLVAEGRSNTEIAAALHVCSSTVRKHLEHAYRKLGVHSRFAAVMVLEEGADGARAEEYA